MPAGTKGIVNTYLRDAAKYRSDAIRIAARCGLKALRESLKALRNGRLYDIVSIIRRQFELAKDPLRDAMLFAHLTGYKRSLSNATMAMSVMANATKLLKERMNLSNKDIKTLKDKYDSVAYKVLRNVSKAVERKIQEALTETTEMGAHVSLGVKRLSEAFDAAGITPDNSFQLENIFRTQTMLAYSAARWQYNQHPFMREILWGYHYTTVGDDRVRPEHAVLDGVKLPADDPFWQRNFPPNGWGCRCVAIEIFEPTTPVPAPAGLIEYDGRYIMPGADAGFEFNPGMYMPAIANLNSLTTPKNRQKEDL